MRPFCQPAHRGSECDTGKAGLHHAADRTDAVRNSEFRIEGLELSRPSVLKQKHDRFAGPDRFLSPTGNSLCTKQVRERETTQGQATGRHHRAATHRSLVVKNREHRCFACS